LDIALYIKELILKNECVILPGFGGFISRYRPANIDSEKKILTPPSKEIEFRKDLKKDNGLLANYIAKKKKIFVTRARRLIEDYVNEINAKLDKGEKVLIKGIGTLVKDLRNQDIKFLSLRDENYLIDSYGLMDLELSEVGKPGNQFETDLQVPPVKIINRKKTGFWVASSIVVLILLLILIIPLTHSDYSADINSRFLYPDKSDSLTREKNEKIVFGQRRIINQDSVNDIGQIIDNATKKEVALFYSEPEDNASEDFISEPNKYYLVAGSFKRLENAERLKSDLLNDGYNSQIIKTENGYVRVILSSFDNRNFAIQELERIRKGLNRNVWILSI
jgi:nucleoid DNA-binding protein